MTYFNKKNPWFWAFIVLLLINVSAIITMIYTINRINNNMDFQPPPPPPPVEKHMPSKMGKMMIKEMGYSKEQVKLLGQIRKTHLKKMRAYQTQLKELQAALFDEISLGNTDSSKVKSLKKKIIEIHELMIDESTAFYTKVKENSTEEQLKKLNKFYKRMLFHHPMYHPRKKQIKQ